MDRAAPEKGWPAAAVGLPVSELGKQGWSLLAGDLPLPCVVIRASALESNSRAMRGFLQRTGAKLCPHGKTSMSPELFHRQIADGAWGITAANARQMQVMRAAGISRVLIANQVVGRAEIAALSEALEDPAFEVFALVDSLASVAELEARLQPVSGRRLKVLLEVGQLGGRTGARTLDAALDVARAVARSRRLALAGVEAFEGILQAEDASALEAKVAGIYAALVTAARACEAEGLFAPGPVILSGGGSAFYDMATQGIRAAGLQAETLMVIRSGCYLTHDSRWLADYYAQMRSRAPELVGPEPQAAIEVWATIQSRPEPRLALATLGKRDVSYDMDLPIPLKWAREGANAPAPLTGHRVTGLNDQHAYLALPPDSPLAVGDLVGFGISHPCTTFDKWRLMAVVDDAYRVVDAVTTRF